ncbi:Hypothetical_protein [Hexamita inflata]|uniref:Hypothetical_protein n=1 Tax=Hexamita inflata TaxID=28002 RepID=A0AA86QLL8_9EUKA|nr:Hypothetical protein HINF_LOCUS48123 [Hexamita inflata]CAI9960488.1 Hypothetical protein HINF_LOCUS48133 [Hexamita inflata]
MTTFRYDVLQFNICSQIRQNRYHRSIFILAGYIQNHIVNTYGNAKRLCFSAAVLTTKKNKRVRQLTNLCFYFDVSKAIICNILYYYNNTTLYLAIYTTSLSHVSQYIVVKTTSNKYLLMLKRQDVTNKCTSHNIAHLVVGVLRSEAAVNLQKSGQFVRELMQYVNLDEYLLFYILKE